MERGGHDLMWCAVLAGWAEPDVEVLASLGWTATKLATLRHCRQEVVESILVSAPQEEEELRAGRRGLESFDQAV